MLTIWPKYLSYISDLVITLIGDHVKCGSYVLEKTDIAWKIGHDNKIREPLKFQKSIFLDFGKTKNIELSQIEFVTAVCFCFCQKIIKNSDF